MSVVRENQPDSPSPVSLDVVVTGHREGNLLLTMVQSCDRARRHLEQEGDDDIRLVVMLDRPDVSTRQVARRIACLRGGDLVVEVDHGDLSLSRNHGVSLARDDYVCFVDGDDMVNRDYFTSHLSAARLLPENVILHPEVVVGFGEGCSLGWQPDQAGKGFDTGSMLLVNPWVSATFAKASVFARVPYASMNTMSTGFGFEDWHWNCDTVAQGYVHRPAPGAAYYYRKKKAGSMNQAAVDAGALMPCTKLFDERWMHMRRYE